MRILPLVLVVIVLLTACTSRAGAQPNAGAAHAQDTPTEFAPPPRLESRFERLGPGERRAGSITIGGADRSYLFYVSTTYDPAVPAPLVLVFHGGSMNATEMLYFGFNAEAERDSALVVYPNGTPREEGSSQRWWSLSPDDRDDLAFVSALLDRVQAEFTIDPARIYATGVSNGGYIGYRVACDLADRVAAVGIVASAAPIVCRPHQPVSVIHIHGTDDPLVPYSLVPRTMRPWRQADGCRAQPTATSVASGVTRESTNDCRDGTEVTLYAIAGGSHTWPGLRTEVAPSSIDATALIAELFRGHHR